ncbi:hypothetical protein M406DRAFT_94269 [Cryphonectria parasitica EP155]|uniref:NmrA-like domain-containing protein n=1 Tax=Cryphonectria parasitica (strain ATCC 38755 / EP155) TaxID=660469 RepID=A0A9P4XYS4_CRYP1|nr:uncharacterized protein M406DRAFT_94269 [Cryphonectria parasitica EP155]KAF3763257.1 hypothetical protein M406DRAFT_94269 [Cryphonectria parasitica EP155]
MSTPLSILIVGAGELGEAILTALAQHPARPSETPLHMLLRSESINAPSPAKQASNTRLQSLGAHLVPGNFVEDDVSVLAATFGRYDVVIQAGGYGLPKGTQLKSAAAALQAGVKRYFPWQFGVDYEAIGHGSAHELFDEMLQVRHLLRSQHSTHWTIISTGLFMSYLFLPDFGVVDLEASSPTVRALGSWENKVTVTTPVDIGRMTAEMVWHPESTLDRVVYIAGETVSYGQLADILEETLELGLAREEWRMDFLRARLRENPDTLWYKYQCIFGDGKGVSWDLHETLNGQRGIKMMTVKEYVLATFSIRP